MKTEITISMNEGMYRSDDGRCQLKQIRREGQTEHEEAKNEEVISDVAIGPKFKIAKLTAIDDIEVGAGKQGEREEEAREGNHSSLVCRCQGC